MLVLRSIWTIADIIRLSMTDLAFPSSSSGHPMVYLGVWAVPNVLFQGVAQRQLGLLCPQHLYKGRFPLFVTSLSRKAHPFI